MVKTNLSQIKSHLKNLKDAKDLEDIKKSSNSVKKHKKIRIAINGFGRIGREVLRNCIDDKNIEVVCINNTHGAEDSRYYLQFDTSQKTFKYKVLAKKNLVVILKEDEKVEIPIIGERKIENIDWSKYNVDIVVESTGVFTTKEDALKHIKSGAKKVIISAPSKTDGCFYFLRGVNDKSYKNQKVVSTASCTTNSMTAIINEIHRKYKIKSGLFSTIHSVTGDQKILDSSHKDFRRGRAGAFNIVPTTTGAQKAVVEIIPSLKNKLSGIAYRVPTPTGSVTDLNLHTQNKVEIESLKKYLKQVSNKLKGIIEYSEEEIVSTDIVGNKNSGIIDSKLISVTNSNYIKLVIWYDNECGYSNRLVEVCKIIGK